MLRYITFGFSIAGVILGLFACAPNPKSEEPCNFVQNVYGQRISWKGQIPIPLLIHASFPREYLSAVDNAIKAWEDSAGRPLFVIVSNTYKETSSPMKDGKSVIYWLNSWETDKTKEQARTSIYWVGDQIREADLRVNDKDFDFFINSSSTSTFKGVHLESLLIHELGHVLGLKHNDETSSVMATYLALQTKRETLSIEDKKAITCEY